jgi:type VI protein secretion system component VasK
MREKRAEPPAKEFLGAWGFYRLLEEAEIELEASSSTMYKISWQFSHSQYKLNVVYRLQARSVANPFKNLGEFFRFHCPSRLD